MAANPTTSLDDIKQKPKVSQIIARDAGMGTVKTFFEQRRESIAAVLPKHVSPDRMLRIALGALQTTPKLMNCSLGSLMGAVVHCAQLGLEPNTPLGHAYLIPFENSRKGVTEVQIVLGYKGLIDLARRSGQIVSISAHEVCENDEFEFVYGLDEKLSHKPAMKNRGDVVAFYAVAKLVGGGHAFEVMSAEQVNAIRDASQNYKFARDKGSTVWGQHYVEMGRKTVLRRLVKYLPVSIELAQAARLDEVSAAGQSQALDNVLEGDYITPAAGDEDGAGGDVIDADTGEVVAASQDAPQALSYDYDEMLRRIRTAPNVDVLDLVGDALSDMPQGDDRVKLEAAYTERREELASA